MANKLNFTYGNKFEFKIITYVKKKCSSFVCTKAFQHRTRLGLWAVHSVRSDLAVNPSSTSHTWSYSHAFYQETGSRLHMAELCICSGYLSVCYQETGSRLHVAELCIYSGYTSAIFCPKVLVHFLLWQLLKSKQITKNETHSFVIQEMFVP